MEINYEKEYFHHLLSDKFNNLRLRVERIVCTPLTPTPVATSTPAATSTPTESPEEIIANVVTTACQMSPTVRRPWASPLVDRR